MDVGSVCELVERVASVDAAVAPLGALTAAAADVARLRSWTDARDAELAGAIARSASFPERALATAQHTSLTAAARLLERTRVLAAAPAFAAALAAGAVRADHVDAFGRALRRLEPAQRAELAGDAARWADAASHLEVDRFARRLRCEVDRLLAESGLDRFDRQRRATSLRTWVDGEGMFRLAGAFDPVAGAKLAARLQATLERLFRGDAPDSAPSDPVERQDHLRALALVALVEGSGAGGGGTDIVAVIDADAPPVAGGPAVEYAIPVEIPAEILAELAGWSRIWPVVVRGGVVLHASGQLQLGRTTRVANRPQRRALRGWYGTCAVPGCTVHYDRCRIHHVVWWRRGGRTDLDNLLPVCHHHHRAIHDDGWELTLGADRSLTIRLPDGEVLKTGPPRRRAA